MSMKFLYTLSLMLAFVLFMSSFISQKPVENRKAYNDSLEKDREFYIAIVNDQIKGKEKMPVDSVFLNLQVLGGFPAENLVFAMKAWSIGLGVSCGHCHNTTDFSLDHKLKKQIAREMVVMGNAINEKIRTIEGLSKRPIVNCITCHRGDLKPAFKIK